MLSRRLRLIFGIVAGVLMGGYLLLSAAFYFLQDEIVYQPTHRPTWEELTPWLVDGHLYGYSRGPATPKAVWLIMQGNAGQAGARGYFKRIQSDESLFILEYPGYGRRTGSPNRASISAATAAAYRELRRRFPAITVGVVGESFGSGPAATLAQETQPPDSIVLIVPVARFDAVMNRLIPVVPVRLLLRDNWDNVATLHDYRGPLTIYAADKDAVIPREQTLLLAASIPQARLNWLPGGHTDPGENGVTLAR